MTTRTSVVLGALMLLALPGSAYAQSGVRLGETVEIRADAPHAYDGVRPGAGHLPPRAAAARAQARRGARLVTWPGFEMLESGGSRFFLQLSASVPVRLERSPGRVTLILPNTRVHVWNNRRPLLTRYFNTPVTRAYLERRGRGLAFVMELRGEVEPSLDARPSSEGFQYVMLTFPPGAYAATSTVGRPSDQPPAAVHAPAEATGLPRDLERLDQERPPGM